MHSIFISGAAQGVGLAQHINPLDLKAKFSISFHVSAHNV